MSARLRNAYVDTAGFDKVNQRTPRFRQAQPATGFDKLNQRSAGDGEVYQGAAVAFSEQADGGA